MLVLTAYVKYTSACIFRHCEILECADLKFPVSGRSKHRYTHVRNAVMLVWGSLRLAPNNLIVRLTKSL